MPSCAAVIGNVTSFGAFESAANVPIDLIARP